MVKVNTKLGRGQAAMQDAEFYCDQCSVIFFATLPPKAATVICPDCGYSHLVEAALQAKSEETNLRTPQQKGFGEWVTRFFLLIIGLGLISFCAVGIFLIFQKPETPLPAQTTSKSTESERRRTPPGAPQQFRQRQQRSFNATETVPMEMSWSNGQVRFYKTDISVETGSSIQQYEVVTRLECLHHGVFALNPGSIFGTAIVLSTDGHLLVRASRFLQGRELMIATNKPRIPAEILLHDRKNDLAVLKVKVENLVPCRIGDFSANLEDQSFAVLGYAQQAIYSEPIQTLLNASPKDPEQRDLLQRIELDVQVDPSFDGAPVINAKGQIIGIAAVPPGSGNQKRSATVQPLNGLNAILKELSITLPAGRSSSLLSISEPVKYLTPVVVRDRYLGPMTKLRFETVMKATPEGTDFNSATGKKVVSAGSTQVSSTGQLSERHIGHTVFQLPHAIHEIIFASLDETGSEVWSTEELIKEDSSSATRTLPSGLRQRSLDRFFYRGRQTRPAKSPQYYRDQTVCRRTADSPETVEFDWQFARHVVTPNPSSKPLITATGNMVFDSTEQSLSSIEKTYRIEANSAGQKQSTVKISAKLLSTKDAEQWNTGFPIRFSSSTTRRVPK